MKKLPVLVAFIALLFFPVVSFAQTFTSNLQKDRLPSGELEYGKNQAELNFLADKGEFSIKFNDLDTVIVFKVEYYDQEEFQGDIETIYSITGNTNYKWFKLNKYGTPYVYEQVSYTYALTISGVNEKGEVAYTTTFYCNLK
jgi:hypothetical protein